MGGKRKDKIIIMNYINDMYESHEPEVIAEKLEKDHGIKRNPVTISHRAWEMGFRKKNQTEIVLDAGFVKIKTPWYTEVTEVIKIIDKHLVLCKIRSACDKDVYLKLYVNKKSGINPDTKTIELKKIRKSHYHDMPDSDFYCLRCKTIYDRSFTRQKGKDGGNKCKNCYNIGRVEERDNNIQAKLRARLHCGFKKMLAVAINGEIKKVNKSALIRYIKDKYNYERPCEVRKHIKEIYNIDISRGETLYRAFKSDEPEYLFKEAFLGCTRRGLVLHIESQFEDGWTWENMGEVWEIDHIKPYNDFDLTDEKQVREVMHYTNVRPLSVVENRQKRANGVD